MEQGRRGLAHDPEHGRFARKAGSSCRAWEAKGGSEGFDFEGTYTRVVTHQTIEYRMSDGREVNVEFVERDGGGLVKETFDAETEEPTRDATRRLASHPGQLRPARGGERLILGVRMIEL